MVITPQKIITDEHQQTLTAIRKHLHAHPELSGAEKETAQYIQKALLTCAPQQILTDLGGHGIAAIFDSGKKGKTLLFRAELDGLPIQEENEILHQSLNPGNAHSCGHDGHMTALLGLAKLLQEQPPKNGKIVLLFQPAEETGVGAQAVLEDPRFHSIQPDAVYAFHNLPGYPQNEIVVREGSFSASVKSLIIRLEGKTSHAAEPEHGKNPALAIANILTQTAQLSNNYPQHPDFSVVTPIYINLGSKNYGTSAGYGEVHLTIRAWTEKNMEKLQHQVLGIVQEAADREFLGLSTEWVQSFQANKADAEKVELVKQAARSLQLSLKERDYPFKWGEDFGQFTQRYPGILFGVGSGVKQPALHNPDYDFPDAILPTAVALFYQIIQEELS